MPSVMQTTRSSPASTPSRIASAAKAGGTKMAEAVAPVCFMASATVSKIGTLSLEQLPAFAGRDAGDDLGAVGEAKLGVPRAEAAGDALDQDAGLGGDEDGHGKV